MIQKHDILKKILRPFLNLQLFTILSAFYLKELHKYNPTKKRNILTKYILDKGHKILQKYWAYNKGDRLRLYDISMTKMAQEQKEDLSMYCLIISGLYRMRPLLTLNFSTAWFSLFP